MLEREDSLPPLPNESPFFFPFKILFLSLKIFPRNKQIFLSIFFLLTLPLSLLLFTLSLSSHPLKSHILHLESVVHHAPTRFEYRHVFAESRDDAVSLLRLKASFFLPIYIFSLLSAIITISSTVQFFHGKRPSFKSALISVKTSWTRPLVTTICIYVILLSYSLVPHTLASIIQSPAARFSILGIGIVIEIYLIAILSLGLVVSVVEERVGFDAIRMASGLMSDRKISGSALTGIFIMVSSFVAWKMDGVMDGVDHWMRKRSTVTSTVVIGVGDKVGLICLYGMVIIYGYVVTTVFYCECRKKEFIRVENEDHEYDHTATV